MTLTTKLTSKGTLVGQVNDNADISYVCHSWNISWIISADKGGRFVPGVAGIVTGSILGYIMYRNL